MLDTLAVPVPILFNSLLVIISELILPLICTVITMLLYILFRTEIKYHKYPLMYIVSHRYSLYVSNISVLSSQAVSSFIVRFATMRRDPLKCISALFRCWRSLIIFSEVLCTRLIILIVTGKSVPAHVIIHNRPMKIIIDPLCTWKK